MAYATPETLPTEYVCRVLTIPNDIDIIIAVNGQINELCQVWNWGKMGAVEPEEVTKAMNDMWRLYKSSTFTCP